MFQRLREGNYTDNIALCLIWFLHSNWKSDYFAGYWHVNRKLSANLYSLVKPFSVFVDKGIIIAIFKRLTDEAH